MEEEVYSWDRILEMRDQARDIYSDEDVMVAISWSLTQEQRIAFIEVLQAEADKVQAH